MQHPETDTGPSGLHWGEKEQTAFAPVPLMTGNAPSHNSKILASVDNPVSCARLMAMIACHLPRLARSPDSALALIAATSSLKSIRSRSLLLLPRARRRLILLPLNTSTHVSDASRVFYFSFNGQGCPDHRVPSSHVCRRMMCLKPLEVTRSSLAHRCTSPYSGSSHSALLHNDVNYNAYSLFKGLWVKHRWWLTIFLWTTSAP